MSLGTFFLATLVSAAEKPAVQPANPVADRAHASAMMSSLPLAFEANQGQTDARVRFLARGAGYTLFLADGEAVLATQGKDGKTDYVRVKLAGADGKARVTGEDQLGGKTNYFIGNDPKKWHTGISDFGKVRYSSVYPGVDVLYYGNHDRLEHDFIVRPGADANKIVLELSGAKKVTIDANSGDLILKTSAGELRLEKPQIYQQVAGKRVEIAGGYKIERHHRVAFQLGAYDRSKELVIDPVLNYGTYLSTAAGTNAAGMAVDGSGAIYVTGTTTSTAFPSPAPVATNSGVGGSGDIYVTKIDPTQSASAQLVYTTFLGGADSDSAKGIALDSAKDAYIVGLSICSAGGYPAVNGQSSCTATKKLATVSELDSTGATLLYSTYYGSGDVFPNAIAVVTSLSAAAQSNVVIVGGTDASQTASANSFSNTQSVGSFDSFITELNTKPSTAISDFACDGSGNATATFTGPTPYVSNELVAFTWGPISPAGNNYNATAFVTSTTATTATYTDPGCTNLEATFPTSGGGGSGMSQVVYSSLLGATGGNSGLAAIAVAGPNAIYVAGTTLSSSFPTKGTPVQSALSGPQDAVIAEFDPTQGTAANTLVASTYLGGSATDYANGIALDTGGNVYVIGETNSSNFPGVSLTAQTTYGGGNDAFVAKLNGALTSITAATYLGGTGSDSANAVAVDSTNSLVWVGGSTTTPTTDNIFNVNALQSGLVSTQDGYIAEYNTALTTKKMASYFGGGASDIINGVAISGTNQVAVAGNLTSGNPVTTSNAYQTSSLTTTSAAVALIANSTTALSSPLSVAGVQSTNVIYTDGGANVATTTYTWTVTNNDGVNPATNVTLDLPIPGGASAPTVTFSGVTPTGMTCTTGTGGVTCQAASIAASGTASVQITVGLVAPCTAASCADIISNASVASAEASSAGTGSITTHQVPVTTLNTVCSAASDVTLTKFVQDTDSKITYSCTVTNTSANPIQNLNFLMHADTASTLTGVATTPAATCNTGGAFGTDVGCQTSLGAGATFNFTLSITPGPLGTNASLVVSNSVTVDSATTPISFFDTNAAANAAISTPFTEERDTTLTYAVTDNGPVAAGAAIKVTGTYANAGNSNAPTLQTTMTLDPALTSVTYNNDAVTDSGSNTLSAFATGNCAAAGSVITCNQGALARLTGTTTFSANATAPVDINLPLTIAAIGTPGAQRATNVVTITTTAPHGFSVGDSIYVAGVTGGTTNFNGTFTVASVPTATTFTYAQTGANDTAGSGTAREAAASQLLSDSGALNTNPAGQVVNATALPLGPTDAPVVQRQSDLYIVPTTSGGQFTANVATTPLAGPLQLTLVVGNNGPNDAINADVRFTLTTGTNITTDAIVNSVTGASYCNVTPGIGTPTQVIDCTIDSLLNGTTATVVVSLVPPVTQTISAGTTNSDTLSATAAISSVSVVDGAASNNATDGLSSRPAAITGETIQRQADLDISSAGTTVTFNSTTSSGSTTVPLSGTITYNYSINNNGPDAAKNVLSSIALTPGSTITIAPTINSNTGATCAYNAAGPSIDCTTASIASSGTNAISVQISVPITSKLDPSSATSATDTLGAAVALGTQVATFDTTTTNNTNSGSSALTLQRTSDLDITGAFTGTATTNLSGSMSYTFNINNHGPDTALNAIARIALSPTTFATAPTVTGQPTGGNCVVSGGNLNCTFAQVATGSASYTVTLTPPITTAMTGASAIPTDTLSANASLQAATLYVDGTAANDTNATTVSTTLQRQSDLQMNYSGAVFSASPSTVSLTGPLTYTVTIKNAGPDQALNIGNRLTLSTGAVTTPFAFVSAVSASAQPVACVAGSTTLDCKFGSLNSGATETLTIKITPPLTSAMNSGAATDAMTTTAATASASVVDDGAAGAAGANNTSPTTVGTTIERLVDLQVTAVAAASSVTGTTTFVQDKDATMSYSVAIQNLNGPDTATSINVTGNVPSNFTLTSAGCTQAGGIGTAVTCNNAVASLAANASTSFQITGTLAPLPAGTASTTSAATFTINSTAVVDSNPANNNGTINITQERDADVQITGVLAGGNVSDPSLTGTGKFIDTADSNIVYQVTLANPSGPSNATDISLNIAVPAGMSLVSGTGCTQGGGAGTAVTCTNALATLNKGATGTFNFTLAPAALSSSVAQQTLTSLVTASGGYNDPTPTNNTNFSVPVSQERDANISLALNSVGDVANVLNKFIETVDAHIHYSVTVANLSSASTGSTVSPTLTIAMPAGAVLFSGTGCTQAGGAGTAVTCASPSVAPGGTQFVIFYVTPSALPANTASQSLVASATASGPYNNANAASAYTNVVNTLSQERDADVGITSITAAGDVAGQANTYIENVDTKIVYTVNVANANTATTSTATDINLTITGVPAGATLVPQAGCTQTSPGANIVCTNAIASLAKGASAAYTVGVMPAPLSTSSASTTVTGATGAVAGAYIDSNSANDSLALPAVTQERVADVSIAGIATAGNNSGLSGKFIESVDTQINYIVTLANANTSTTSTATDITLTATVPSGTTVGSGACSITGTTLTCTNAVPSLAKGGNTAFSFSLIPTPLSAGTATNAFNISMDANGAYTDPVPANNTGIASGVSQERDADVSIAVAAQGNVSGTANTFVETVDTQENYTVTVTNANTAATSTATDITITSTVPSGTTLGTIPASGCSISGTTLTCTNAIASLAKGATTTFAFSLVPTALAAGTTQQSFVVSTSAAGGYNDPNNTNNTNIGNTTSQERDADVAITAIAAVGNNSGVSGKLIDSVDTQINYTVSLLNSNTATTSTATDITITASLPSGTTLGTIPASGCSISGTLLTCTNAVASLAKNAATTFSFSLVPSALAANTSSVSFPITVTAAGAYNDANPANNTNIPNTVSQERDADVTINTVTTVGNNSALANTFVATQDTALTVTIPLSNSSAANTSAATDLTLTVIVPSGTTLNGSATVNGSPVSCSISGTTLTCTNLIASLAAGASDTVVLPLVPPALGTNSTQPFNLTFSVTGGYIDANSADNINISGPSVTVERETDLAITSIAANTTAGVSTFARVSNISARTDLITYTATVHNNGPSDAQALTVTDVLPANLTFTSSASGCTASGQTVTCAIATLANGATTTVSFVATPNLATTLATLTVSNTASVASSQSVDNTPGNNSPASPATLDLLGDADVNVTVTPTPTTNVNVGQSLSYVVTVANNGPWPAAAGAITVVSTVPFSGMAVSAPGFTCNSGGGTCVLNSSLGVGAGSAVTITFTGTVPASAVTGLTTALNESSTASTTIVGSNYTTPTDYTDAATGNNTGAASVTGNASADLTVSQVANGPVLFNNTVTYTLTVTNNAGLSPALNPQVVSTVTIVPANSVASITGLSAGCSATAISGGTATVTCNLPQINSGSSATASFSLLPALPGQISNSATVNDGAENDPGSGNNSAAALLTIVDNTPTGTNVTVAPSDSTTGLASGIATMVFANVSAEGTTHFDVLGSGTLPFNYRSGSAPNFYAVNTTATYSGTLDVCINYSPTTFQKPERVRLFADNLDITTSLNQTTSMVCGQFPATQLLGTSPVQLSVVEPVNHAPVASGTATSNSSSTGKGGITGSGVLLDSSSTVDQDNDPCNGATVASGVKCSDYPKLKFVWTSSAFKDFPVHTVDCQNPLTPPPGCYQLSVSMSVGASTVQLVAYDQLGAASAPVIIPVSVNGVTAGTGTITAITVSPGQAGTFNQLGLSFTNSTASSVTYDLTIGGTPDLKAAQITCNISPSSVTVAAGQTVTQSAQITCSTTGPTFANLEMPTSPVAPSGALPGMIATAMFPVAGLVLLLPIGTRRRRYAKILLVLGLVMMLSMVLVSCGGGGAVSSVPKLQNAGTPAGTYTLTISDQFGNSYVVQNSSGTTVPLTLTVN